MSSIKPDQKSVEYSKSSLWKTGFARGLIDLISYLIAALYIMPETIIFRTIEILGVLILLFGAGLLAGSIYGISQTQGQSLVMWVLLLVAIVIPIVYYKFQFDSELICENRTREVADQINRYITHKLGMNHMAQVTLRSVFDADLPIFFEHQQYQPAQHMAAFVHEDPSDRIAFDTHWAKLIGSDKILKRSIEHDSELVGHIMSFDMPNEEDGLDREITYWIGHEYWGKGIATQALLQFIEIEQTRPLFGRAATDNLGSIRSMEKCGFALIAHERGFAHARGEEIDEVVMKLE
ncbi:MAG: GNAT family N-acetyltransferase [Phycisphaerales bacterium]|nr:GNAT family N-acetyltransferase [Phycisphaerales bacterium]